MIEEFILHKNNEFGRMLNKIFLIYIYFHILLDGG